MRRFSMALVFLAAFPGIGFTQGTPVEIAVIVAAPTVTNTAGTQNIGAGTASVTITGAGFDTNAWPNTDTVTFSGAGLTGNVAGVITATTADGLTITATMPSGVTSGALSAVVTANGGSSGAAVAVATLLPAPTITSVSPATGPVTGGTSVAISGTNLGGATAVNLSPGTTITTGLSLPTEYAVYLNGQSAAAGNLGTNPVFYNDNGNTLVTWGQKSYSQVDTLNTGAAAFTTAVSAINTALGITVPPAIFANRDQLAANNENFTVSGFTVGNTYTIALLLADFTFPNASGNFVQIKINGTVQNPSGGTAGCWTTGSPNIYASGITGTAQNGMPAYFLYTGVAQAGGANGTGKITILSWQNGSEESYFCGGVYFTGTFGSPLTVTAPAITTGGGVYPVYVTTPGGTNLTPGTFTYQPTITSVSPNAGPLTPTSPVTITGSGFTGATQVNFGGNSVLAANFVSASETQIVVLPPTGAAGGVAVSVVAKGTGATGPATSTNSGFTYVGPPGTLTLSPTNGPVTGGTTLAINGTSTSTATSVTVGGLPATINPPTIWSMRLQNATPAGQFLGGPTGGPGTTGQLTIANGTNVQTTAAAINVSYVGAYNAPQTIFQNGFYGPNTYTVTGLNASSTYTVALFYCEQWYGPGGGDNQAAYTAGTRRFNVLINGTQVDTNLDIWETANTINGGAGGTNVGIYKEYQGTTTATGTLPIQMVAVADNPVLMAIVVTPNFATVTVPAINTGGGYAGAEIADVVLTTPYGTGSSLAASGGGYSYLPAVATDTPTSIPLVPTSPETISGTGFLNATSVTFGSAPAISIPSNTSDTTIVVTPPTASAAGVPAGGNVAVSVSTLTATQGTLTSITTGTMIYTPPPTITTLSSTSGPVTGGQGLIISGSGLGGVSSVLIGGAAATITPGGLSTIGVCAGTNTPETQGTVTFAGQTTYSGAGLNGVGSVNALATQLQTKYPYITTALFQGQNTGTNTTYTFGGLQASSPVTVTMFLAETFWNVAGGRVTTVTINGTVVDAAQDVWNTANTQNGGAGGRNVGCYFTYSATSTTGGQLQIVFTTKTDQPEICGGIMIQGIFPTQVSVTTPVVTFGGGQYPVVVTGPGGPATNTPTYSYLPVIATMTPNTGPTLTSQPQVTITGNGFSGGATVVNFGSIPGTGINVTGDTSITVTPPLASAQPFGATGGTVTVTVAAQGTGTGVSGPATSTTNSTYTYVPPPVIAGITPPEGPVGGGGSVTINGTAVGSATSVTFNVNGVPVPATGLVGQSTVAINCGGGGAMGTFSADAPYFAGGTAPGYIGGVNGGAAAGTPTVVPPTTAALFPSPLVNTAAVQNQIVMSTRYDGANSGFSYTIPNLVPNSTCTVTLFFAEDWFGIGANGFGTGTAAGGSRVFNVFVNGSTTPQIANYDPYKEGLAINAATGSNVLTAQQFTATATTAGTLQLGFVSVVNQALVCAIVVTGDFTNSTSLVLTPPAITGTGYTGPEQVDVTLTTPYGTTTYAVAAGGGYSYAPAVTSVSPGFGPYTPIGPVTINGSGFTGATTLVQFGSAAPITVTPTSDNAISVTPPTATAAGVPAGGAVVVTVSVVTATGTISSLTNGGYDYLQPTIAAITPNIGPTEGGNSVVITGNIINNPLSVTIGGNPATITSGPALAMCAGSPTAVGTSPQFVGEVAGDVAGGTAVVSPAGTVVNTVLVNVLGAPAGLFNNGRTAATPVTYTIPGLNAGASYSVALFFCETEYAAAGSRQFNVSINGTQVLTNFDIWNTANSQSGSTGSNMAIYQEFNTTATGGQIQIALTNGTAGLALINGMLISPSLTVTVPAGSAPGPVAVAVTTPQGIGTSPGGYTYLGATAVATTTPTGAYTVGTVIPITVTFSGPVTVTGVPTLNVNTTPTSEAAAYSSGSGTTALTFLYTIASGDTTQQLDYSGTTALTLAGGTIMSAAGTNSSVALPANGAGSSADSLYPQNIIIDTTPPAVTFGTPVITGIGPSATVAYPVNYADTNFSTSTLAVANVTLTTTGTAGGTIQSVTGTGTNSCTVTIGNITGTTGTMNISIAANTASDTAGNQAPIAGPSGNVSVGTPYVPTVLALVTGGGNTYAVNDQLQVQGGVEPAATPPYTPAVLTVTSVNPTSNTVATVTVAPGSGGYYTTQPGPTNVATTDTTTTTATGAVFTLTFANPTVATATVSAGGGPITSDKYQMNDILQVMGGAPAYPGFMQVTGLDAIGQVNSAQPYNTNAPNTPFVASNPTGTASAGYYNPASNNPPAAATTNNVTNALLNGGTSKAFGVTVTVPVAPLTYTAATPLTTGPISLTNAGTSVTLAGTSFTSLTPTTGTYGVQFQSDLNPSYSVTFYTYSGTNYATPPTPQESTIAGFPDSQYNTSQIPYSVVTLTLTLTNPITAGTTASVNSGTTLASNFWPVPSSSISDYFNAFWGAAETAGTTYTVTTSTTPYTWIANPALPGQMPVAPTAATVNYNFTPANVTPPETRLGLTSYMGNAGMYMFNQDTTSPGTGAVLTCTVTPPTGGAVTAAAVKTGGSGYPVSSPGLNLAVSDGAGGTGAIVQVTTNGSGQVASVVSIVAGGTNYVSPTVDSGGTTVDASTVPESGSNSQYSNGPLFADSLTRINEITDGTSNTLLFGETLGGQEGAVPTYGYTWMSAGVMPTYWDCQTPSTWYTYGSNHPGFVNFAFCDGSVRSVSKVAATDQWSAGTPPANPPPNPPNPPTAATTPRWNAFQLLGGMSDGKTADIKLLGMAP